MGLHVTAWLFPLTHEITRQDRTYRACTARLPAGPLSWILTVLKGRQCPYSGVSGARACTLESHEALPSSWLMLAPETLPALPGKVGVRHGVLSSNRLRHLTCPCKK